MARYSEGRTMRALQGNPWGLFLITHAKPLAAFRAPPFQDQSAALGRHPGPEAVCLFSLAVVRLKCPLHGSCSPTGGLRKTLIIEIPEKKSKGNLHLERRFPHPRSPGQSRPCPSISRHGKPRFLPALPSLKTPVRRSGRDSEGGGPDREENGSPPQPGHRLCPDPPGSP